MIKITFAFGLLFLLAFFLNGMEASATIGKTSYIGAHPSPSTAPLCGLIYESKTTEEYDDDNSHSKIKVASKNLHSKYKDGFYLHKPNRAGAQAILFLSSIRVLA